MKFCEYVKAEVDYILASANLTEDEEELFNVLARGMTITEASVELGMSDATIDRKIKKIKDKIERVDAMEIRVPVWEKVMLTKEEAAEYSHIGINKLEELLKLPNCPFVLYVGKKKLIKRKEFEQFLSKNIEI